MSARKRKWMKPPTDGRHYCHEERGKSVCAAEPFAILSFNGEKWGACTEHLGYLAMVTLMLSRGSVKMTFPPRGE